MNSKFLGANRRLLVTAAIVVAGYFAVAWWFESFNPLAWLLRSEIRLKPTLLELAEVNEIEELIAAEYFGEVLAALDEIRPRLASEVPAAYDTLRAQLLNGQRLRPDSLLAYAVIYGMLRKAKIKLEEYIRAHEFRDFEKDHFKKFRKELENKDLVYLARGKVRLAYDLKGVLARAECEDAAGIKMPLADCELAQAKKLRLFLSDSLRRITVNVNPFFVYKSDTTKAIHGFEVIIDQNIRQDFELIKEVRRRANHLLQETALRHGLVQRADESLRQTVEGFLRAVFAAELQVVIAAK